MTIGQSTFCNYKLNESVNRDLNSHTVKKKAEASQCGSLPIVLLPFRLLPPPLFFLINLDLFLPPPFMRLGTYLSCNLLPGSYPVFLKTERHGYMRYPLTEIDPKSSSPSPWLYCLLWLGLSTIPQPLFCLTYILTGLLKVYWLLKPSCFS